MQSTLKREFIMDNFNCKTLKQLSRRYLKHYLACWYINYYIHISEGADKHWQCLRRSRETYYLVNPHIVTHDLLLEYNVNTWSFLTLEQTFYFWHQFHLLLILLLLGRIQLLTLYYNGKWVGIILNTSCEHVVSVFDKLEERFSDANIGFSHITLCTLHSVDKHLHKYCVYLG